MYILDHELGSKPKGRELVVVFDVGLEPKK
jgi:hypothetical protein